MQVHHDEGVANRIDPESCAVAREGFGEALTGDHAGQPLSHEMNYPRVPTRLATWKAIRTGAPSRAPGRPGVVADPGMCGRSLRGSREISRSTNGRVSSAALVRIGKARSRSR